MTTYIQETDTKIVFPLSSTSFVVKPINQTTGTNLEDNEPISLEQSSQTIGDSLQEYYYSVPKEYGVIQNAWLTISNAELTPVSIRSKAILTKIHSLITRFQQLGVDLNYLPPLKAFSVDDNSILIEWIFHDFRIGFNIEEIQDESSWYLITKEKLGGINASGFLMPDSQKITSWLINFALAYT